MERNVNYLINTLKEKIKTLREYQTKLKLCPNSPLNSGKLNQLSRLVLKAKGDVHYYAKLLNEKGKGNIINFSIKVGGEIFNGILVNLSKEDVEQLILLQKELYNQNIEILEIKETPTSIMKVGL
ncbi:MAG: hypothetical protein RSC49_02180 [Clostridium sp.]